MEVGAGYLRLYYDRFRQHRRGRIEMRQRVWGEGGEEEAINRHGCTQNSIYSIQQTLSNKPPATRSFNPHPLGLFIPGTPPRKGIKLSFYLAFLPSFSLMESGLHSLWAQYHHLVFDVVSLSLSLTLCIPPSPPLLSSNGCSQEKGSAGQLSPGKHNKGTSSGK